MTENEKKNQSILVSKASQSYKNFIEDGVDPAYKEKRIGRWLKNHSSYLHLEKRIERGKYISCKEGTLIYCDFGINPGAEISDWHFAIVLNKNDNSYNPILTVIPLTSKSGSRYIDIGDEVYQRTIDSIKLKFSQFHTANEKLEIALDFAVKLKDSSTNPDVTPERRNRMLLESVLAILKLCDVDIEGIGPDQDPMELITTSI